MLIDNFTLGRNPSHHPDTRRNQNEQRRNPRLDSERPLRRRDASADRRPVGECCSPRQPTSSSTEHQRILRLFPSSLPAHRNRPWVLQTYSPRSARHAEDREIRPEDVDRVGLARLAHPGKRRANAGMPRAVAQGVGGGQVTGGGGATSGEDAGEVPEGETEVTAAGQQTARPTASGGEFARRGDEFGQ